MVNFPATIRDFFRKERKKEFNPDTAFKAQPKNQDPKPMVGEDKQLSFNFVEDPYLEWGKSLEKFQEFQVQSGMEIIKSGQEAQTAGELDNLNMAKQDIEKNQNNPDFQKPVPQLQKPDFQGPHPPNFKEPFNNPFSSIPGR